MFEDRDTLWVVHIGKGDHVPLRARDEGFICTGWTAMGDQSQYTTREATRAATSPRRTDANYIDRRAAALRSAVICLRAFLPQVSQVKRCC